MKKAIIAFLLTSTVAFAHHGVDQQVTIISNHIKKKPSCSLLTHRASLYLKKGQKNKAFMDLEEALKLNPDFEPAKNLLKSLVK